MPTKSMSVKPNIIPQGKGLGVRFFAYGRCDATGVGRETGKS